MRATTRIAVVVLALALGGAGCNSAKRLIPSAQTPLPQTAPPPATTPIAPGPFVLSGVVFETMPTGRAPVENVQVYCDACGEGHVSVQTDANGAYRFSDVKPGSYAILVHKTGYDVIDSIDTFGGWSGRRVVTVNGDTQFDIQVRRR